MKTSDALEFYGDKRYTDSVGVTQPSQRRYVEYFEDVLKMRTLSSPAKELVKIVIHTQSNISSFKIFMGNPSKTLVYNLFESIYFPTKIFNSKGNVVPDISEKGKKINLPPIFQIKTIILNTPVILSGDYHIYFFYKDWVRRKLRCRVSFNTGFIRNK